MCLHAYSYVQVCVLCCVPQRFPVGSSCMYLVWLADEFVFAWLCYSETRSIRGGWWLDDRAILTPRSALADCCSLASGKWCTISMGAFSAAWSSLRWKCRMEFFKCFTSMFCENAISPVSLDWNWMWIEHLLEKRGVICCYHQLSGQNLPMCNEVFSVLLRLASKLEVVVLIVIGRSHNFDDWLFCSFSAFMPPV